ncbi:MAG: N-acetyltransferase [Anaerolineae bacterium]|nr:N-acetyltransferase [Anaerolineae bacterium]
MKMIRFRPLLATDWQAVSQIYAEGIATGNATFQTTLPEWSAWDQSHRPACRIVACTESGEIAGWAALTPYSSREVYAGVADESIYIAAAFRGQGIGMQLLTRLIEESEAAGVWTLQAGIFPENQRSLQLHQNCGFRLVGRREKIGQLHGHWRDVLLWERRSPIVGNTP